MIEIKKVTTNKKQYLPLLLLADEQEDMIDRYLERGTMYILDDNGVKGVCVVTDEGDGILEIKNIATDSHFHRKGYGRMLIKFIEETYHNQYSILQVGTGDSPLTIPFYEACGFVRSHAVKDFFVKNYDHAIYECGIQLKDMIYLQKTSYRTKKEAKTIARFSPARLLLLLFRSFFSFYSPIRSNTISYPPFP